MNALHWLTIHGLVTLFAVLVYVFSSHVLHQRRQPTAAIAWMMFILLLPYVALPAFLAFGSRKLARPTLVPVVRNPSDRWVEDTILSLGQPLPSAYSDLNLHEDGAQAHAALLRVLEGAQATLDLSTFILGRDAFGEAVIERLTARARAGVRVRLMLDGMGSLMQGRPGLDRLLQAGGAFVLFVPPLRSPIMGRTNLRNHRKLVVADAGLPSAWLWCGGRNLAAEYFEGSPGRPPWRDLSFDLRGPLVDQAAALFHHDWAFATGVPFTPPVAPAAGLAEPVHADGAQLVASGPDQVDDTVLALLVTAAFRSRSRIALVTPYFVPDASLQMALCLAARRGVAVDLLVPRVSNHWMSDMARGRALRALAQAGVRIWLAPDMVHAKLAVFDDALALAGSANLDSRSLLLNYELMMAFQKTDDVRRFMAWFERARANAQPYTAQAPGLVRDMAEGMLLWVGFQL